MPSLGAVRLAGFASALCLGLMLALLVVGGAPSAALLLVGAGGTVMLVTCAMAEG